MPSENTLKDAHKVNEPKILNSWILLNAPCNIQREKLIWLKELRDIPQLGCVALGYLGDFVTMDERLEIKAAPWKKLKADLHGCAAQSHWNNQKSGHSAANPQKRILPGKEPYLKLLLQAPNGHSRPQSLSLQKCINCHDRKILRLAHRRSSGRRGHPL